jgi:hypothetical protein
VALARGGMALALLYLLWRGGTGQPRQGGTGPRRVALARGGVALAHGRVALARAITWLVVERAATVAVPYAEAIAATCRATFGCIERALPQLAVSKRARSIEAFTRGKAATLATAGL